MSDSNLNEILTNLLESSSGRTHFGEHWSQGRSAFGGIAASFAVTQMRKLLTSPQPIRSLMVSFIGPLPPGEAIATATLLRQGKNVTQMTANVFSGDTLCLQAMGVFGNPRPSISVPSAYEFSPAPKEQGINFEKHKHRLPPFLSYFDGYWVSPGMPFSGQASNQLNMWVRHKTDMTLHPIEKMVVIADIPPPVILSHFEKPPIPSSSLTWSLEFVIPPDQIYSEWFYLEYSIESAADGYMQQAGKIFTETGKLCALSRQCMVYFEPQATK
ncbi:MAG: acyl-CoA thioesterase [Pseudohongiellaceae bacterium]|jgi:acyl-CoA thioesterase